MKQPLIKLRASEAVLAEAQQMAHAGNWHIDLLAKSYVCSAEAYLILGVDPTVWIKTRREGVYLGGMPAARRLLACEEGATSSF